MNAKLDLINIFTYKIYLVSWRSRFIILIFEAKHSHYSFDTMEAVNVNFFSVVCNRKKNVFETTGRGIICSERFIILICWCRVFYQVKKLAKSLPSFECSYDQETWTQHGATLTSLHWKLYNQFSLHRFRLGGNMFQPKAFLIWIYILLALEYFSLFSEL